MCDYISAPSPAMLAVYDEQYPYVVVRYDLADEPVIPGSFYNALDKGGVLCCHDVE